MHVESLLLDLLIYLGNKYNCIELNEIGFFSITQPVVHKNDTTGSLELQPIRFVYQSQPVFSCELVRTAEEEGIINKDNAQKISTYLQEKAAKLKAVGEITIPGLGQLRQEKDKVIFQPDPLRGGLFEEYFPSVPFDIASISSKHAEYIQEEGRVISSMKGQKIQIDPNEGGWMRYFGPFALLAIGIAGMILFMKYCTATRPELIEKTESVPIDPIPSTTNTTRDTTQEMSGIFNNIYLNRYKDILTQQIIDEGCKITVGSFRREVNAQSLATDLANKGYSASIEDFEEGKRVIITFDCAAHDLEMYLYKIREEVTPNAWYLQPDWDPEDELEE